MRKHFKIFFVLLPVVFIAGFFLLKQFSESAEASASEWNVVNVSVSSEIAGWPKESLMDDNVNSLWSSQQQPNPNHTEWAAYWFDTYHETNYIKLYPRVSNGDILSFPVEFRIAYSDGANWIDLFTYTDFPTPDEEDWVILPFLQTVNANGLRIYAQVLGEDNNGKNYFQLGEVSGGYDSGFKTMQFLGMDADSGINLFENVGADQFNPNKISNWNYDYRLPLYKANCPGQQNIYASKAEWNESTDQWYVYYGGNDAAPGVSCDQTHDRIFMVPTDENFSELDYDQSRMIIDQGSFRNVNNPALTRSLTGQWAMVYTSGWCPEEYGDRSCVTEEVNDEHDLPAYALSNDGITWSPNNPGDPFGTNNLITMNNFHNGVWDEYHQYINNQNGLLYDDGYYWYYYGPEGLGGKDYRGYSTDMMNFTETGSVMDNVYKSVNDVKKFRYNGSDYYMMLAQQNGTAVDYSLSTDPAAFPELQTLFATTQVAEGEDGYGDDWISDAGLVTDGTTLYGALYGGHDDGEDHGFQAAIYSIWLQKKVYFSNGVDIGWGSVERADGPNKIRLAMAEGNHIQNGQIYMYDTDGTTLLFTSPKFTMTSGMRWRYNDSALPCGLSGTADWNITSDCTIDSIVTAPKNVTVSNGATLTIGSSGALDIDFDNRALKALNGSRIKIKNGGKIQ